MKQNQIDKIITFRFSLTLITVSDGPQDAFIKAGTQDGERMEHHEVARTALLLCDNLERKRNCF